VSEKVVRYRVPKGLVITFDREPTPVVRAQAQRQTIRAIQKGALRGSGAMGGVWWRWEYERKEAPA
jgi:hypothetical protein